MLGWGDAPTFRRVAPGGATPQLWIALEIVAHSASPNAPGRGTEVAPERDPPMPRTLALFLAAPMCLAACGPTLGDGGAAPPGAPDDDPGLAVDTTPPTPDAAAPAEQPDAAAAFTCSGAGIAAFADQLVAAARTSCTSDGIGVVTDTNYDCLQGPIFELAPPYPAEAFGRVRYWAHYGNNFSGRTSLFQCVDF